MIKGTASQSDWRNIYRTASNLKEVALECMHLQRYQDAIFLFSKAKDHMEKIFGVFSPEASDILCKMGVCFQNKNEADKADKCFKKAYKINKNLVDIIDVESEQFVPRKRSVSC
jgi:tetratricopeptide (TPR) repeat protein